MFKNKILKEVLKATVFNVASLVNKVLPKDDKKILLYCNNWGLRDNSKYLYDYMIAQGINKKYKIICGVENMKYQGEPAENVIYMGQVRAMWEYMFTKHVFYSFGQVPIYPTKSQMVLHMTHGSPMKKADVPAKHYYSKVIATSDEFVPIVAKDQNCSEDEIVVCGYPRTDAMYGDVHRYNMGDCEHFILWTPTFRKSDYLGMEDGTSDALIPLYELEQLYELNEVLKKQNCKLMIKLHPHQNLQQYEMTEMSNLLLYSHEDFGKKGYELYYLLGQTDALITDYSSIVYDYLLLERPIAFTIDDMEDYTRGFAMKNPKDFMPGPMITEKKQFEEFVVNLSQGVDAYAADRTRVNRFANKYQDGENCKRILEISGIIVDGE